MTPPATPITAPLAVWAPLLALMPACSSTPSQPEVPDPTGDEIVLTLMASGLSDPLYVTSKLYDTRLFVVEQTGTVRIFDESGASPTPYLDISDKTRAGGERGLLSVAFHPDETKPYVFVNYTDLEGKTVIERYEEVPGQIRADPTTAVTILTVDQPFGNHNGGQLQFGPDGLLYIGMGDGGSGGDPRGHGQNRNTLLGALLRLDVDGGTPYAIPPDNPYVGGGGRPEIWAIGLRNPWRFSFDRQNGDLYIADVGQNRLEEINVRPGSEDGVNYGWNVMEGTECFGAGSCDPGQFTPPVLEYDHSQGCSVTGGYVYRGSRIARLNAHYVYADYCQGWIRSFRYVDGAATDQTAWNLPDVGAITSFGQDAMGELYVTTASGNVYRIDPAEGG